MELTKGQLFKLYEAVGWSHKIPSRLSHIGELLLRKFEDMTDDEKVEYDNITSEPYFKDCAYKFTLWALEKGFCLDESWFKKGYAERIVV